MQSAVLPHLLCLGLHQGRQIVQVLSLCMLLFSYFRSLLGFGFYQIQRRHNASLIRIPYLLYTYDFVQAFFDALHSFNVSRYCVWLSRHDADLSRRKANSCDISVSLYQYYLSNWNLQSRKIYDKVYTRSQ